MSFEEASSNAGFYELREEFRARFAGPGAVRESSPSIVRPERVSERIVQAIWYERLLRTDGLKTESGKTLSIDDPGRWNEGPGPDFLGASLTIGGKKTKGDIEAHVDAGQWRAHRHNADFEYNRVALHVFLNNDDGRKTDELHNGNSVERFEMLAAVFPDLETIKLTLSPEDYPYDSNAGIGLCHEFCTTEDESFIRRFLATGGRERLHAKIRRLSGQLAGGDFSQLFYQSLMTAMGHKSNKALFFLRSKRAPIEELLDHSAEFSGLQRVEAMEAVLLHVAGLTPRTDASNDLFDSETLEYLNRINCHWSELSGYFSDRIIPATKRWNASLRPASLPSRRLAGIAQFAARHARGRDLFGPFAEKVRSLIPGSRGARALKAFLKEIENLFTVEAPQDYWASRYTFPAKPSPKPMSLIGASRARSIAFNSLLPLMILYARRDNDKRLEEFLWQWFERFPCLESNNIVRFMRYRLFGGHDRAKSLLDTELMQQGLFQVFQSCCNNHERDCSNCHFLREMEQ